MTQRDDTEFQTHLHTAGRALLNDIAHQEGHDALGLVVLDHLDHVLGLLSLAQDNGNTGDIAGDQRHAQGTDDRIGHEADAALVLVGVALDIAQTLQDLSANGGGKTGIESLTQILLVGDEALEDTDTGRQVQ